MKTQALAKVLALGLLFAAACGGTQTGDGGETPGQTHSTPRGNGDGASDDDIDIDSPLHTPGAADAGETMPGKSDAPVTFVIKNSGSDTLFLNMDKGLQAVISGYSGKVPNAKQLLLFPTHCTASCDSEAADMCPVCEEPQRVKEIKAAENHEPIEPGSTYEVPWDGIAFKDKRTKKGTRNGKRVACNCFETLDPEPEDYTIRACGLRKTQSAKARSQYLCVEASITLPITEPVRLELDFDK
tara:strand:+ start:67402 stop:68127 length:726 start_codon:yes stop_codon:yes gene_type:complete